MFKCPARSFEVVDGRSLLRPRMSVVWSATLVTFHLLHHIYCPINRSISQSANPSINHSINSGSSVRHLCAAVHISADHHRWAPPRSFQAKIRSILFPTFFGPGHPLRVRTRARLGQISSDLCAPFGPSPASTVHHKAQHDPRPTCAPARRAPGHPLGPLHPQAPRSHPISGFHSSPSVRLHRAGRAAQRRGERRTRESRTD